MTFVLHFVLRVTDNNIDDVRMTQLKSHSMLLFEREMTMNRKVHLLLPCLKWCSEFAKHAARANLFLKERYIRAAETQPTCKLAMAKSSVMKLNICSLNALQGIAAEVEDDGQGPFCP